VAASVPVVLFGLDPLIAEAKERARRRRLRALGAVAAIAAAAIGTTFGLRSSARALGVCATPPSGWRERTVTRTSLGPPAIVLTNWRFGRMEDFYGLGGAAKHWLAGGVTVVVLNEGPAATPPIGRALRVTYADFGRFEGMRFPSAEVAVRSHGRVLNSYVEVGTVTPATIAAANRALAGVQVCSV
jgi:hypothetical protein